MAASRAYGKNVLTLSVPGLCERSAVLQAHDAPPRLHRGHRVVILPHPRLLLGYDFQGNYWKCRRCIMAFQSGSQSVRLVNKSFVVEGLRKCDLETTRVQPRFFLLHIAMHGGLNCRSKCSGLEKRGSKLYLSKGFDKNYIDW